MLAIKVKNESKFIDEKLFTEYDEAFMTKDKEQEVYKKIVDAYNKVLRNIESAERFMELVEETYGYGLMLKVKRPSKERGHFGLYSPRLLEDGRIHLLLSDGVSTRTIKWETAYKYYEFKLA